MQENLPKRMGRALRGVGDLDRKEDKVYPTWDVAIDRFSITACSYIHTSLSLAV